MIKFIVISFFIVQIVFTLLDLGVLCRQGKNKFNFKALFKSPEDRDPLLFIVAVWLVYFVLQSLGTFLLPGFDSIKEQLYKWLQISPLGASAWTWKVSLVFLWSFHVIGFWDFVTHRWVLHRNFFWIFHEYHHLPTKVFNGMPGVSARPFVFFTTMSTYVCSVGFILWPLQLLSVAEARAFLNLGLPLLAFWLTLVLSINHSLFLRQFPSVHYFLKFFLIATPQEHILHHSNYLRCNYGNFSTIWDHLFKSYIDPMKRNLQEETLGLDYDQDYLGTLCWGKFKLSEKIRRRFRLKDTVCLKD